MTTNPQQMHTQSAGRPDPQEASVADLLATLGQDTTRLMRQELALAKAETKQEAAKAGMGIGELLLAGLAAQLALIMLSFAAVEALDGPVTRGWAYVIVGAVWLVLAAILAAAGRAALKRTEITLPKTQETVKELPDTVKGQGR
jgi:hypothetical protein